MAAKSNIEWTDATVNFWHGCTKVGPGCDHCYAETWAKRTGGDLWGVGAPRRKIKGAPALIHRLDNGYAEWFSHFDRRRRVFIQSMSDLFDNEAPIEWFAEAWDLIERCNRIDVQIVTKRVSIVDKRLAAIGKTTWPKHVGLMVTVCNQEYADRDVPRLLALAKKFEIPWTGISAEPLLGTVDFRRVCLGGPSEATFPANPEIKQVQFTVDALVGAKSLGWRGLDLVIVGGESGPRARPCWTPNIRSVVRQCAEAGVACFVKQLGGNVQDRNDAGFDGDNWDGDPLTMDWPAGTWDRVEEDLGGHVDNYQGAPVRIHLRDRKGGDMAEWPEGLRVREMPRRISA